MAQEKKVADKRFLDMCDGFQRTQAFNEYKQPIIVRTTALTQSVELIKLFGIDVSLTELFIIQAEMFDYLESGDTKVFRTLYDKTNGKSPLAEDKPNK
jgi:hypothetical protein